MYAWRFKQLVADSTNEELVTQHPENPSGSGVCRRDAMQFLFRFVVLCGKGLSIN